MKLVSFRAVIAGLSLAGLALSLDLVSGCLNGNGGCGFTQVSPVTVEPATSCLTIVVENADADSNGPDFGCLYPALSIANRCKDPLVFDGSNVQLLDASGNPVQQDAGPFSIAPGKTSLVSVQLSGDQGPEAVNATLGSQPIEMTFTTQ